MFNGFLTRLVAAVGLFVAGLHLIGWGMIENGSAHPRNPIWRSLSAFFAFELNVLKVLGWMALALAAGFVVIRIILNWRAAPGPEESRAPMPRATGDHNASTLTHYLTPSSQADATATVAVAPACDRQTNAALPRPAPSPEELKKKAIDQILKGF